MGGSSVQLSIFYVKEVWKKARERILLCRAKSYASLDEELSQPSMAEKKATTNIDQIETVERVEESRSPCTCVGKPFLISTPCRNTAKGDINAAPSESEGLPSRKKKTKLVTPLLKNNKIKSSSFHICFIYFMCLAVFVSFCAVGFVHITSSKGRYN